jgi:hypothetical protein
MLKKTGKLLDDWTYKIVQRERNIKITFNKGTQRFVVEEYMEMAGFGINDYDLTYLQYLLNNKLGISTEKKDYKPTIYH